ncbi:MAG: phosphoribosylamine--glycine ligase [Planctomycetota bacterium]|nr:MAG: phosphoribosylamine--glycine ligase [Planctomycetota bacterium]
MQVLVVGSGGREHALAWKIAQSPEVTEVFVAPGNGGMGKHATCVPIGIDKHKELIDFAKEKKVGLVVIGPEAPLCAGLGDRMRKEGIAVFGPDQKAAEIEGSKAFTRDLCKRHHVPGPQSWTFTSSTDAVAFVDSHRFEKIVVKADGLAAGKGVTICEGPEEARKAVLDCLENDNFGAAGHRVVIEEFLTGHEISVLALSDGRTIVPLESAKDHKARFEGDKGPNTGGMGAVSPSPAANPRTLKQVESQVLVQTIHGLVQEGRPYQGVLYAGLMITPQGPRVLEFNARFGDPETQALLMRMNSDIVPFLDACARGKLEALSSGPEWDPRPAACVIAVSDGYPGTYTKGHRIFGLDELEESDDFVVFHSGTVRHLDGHAYTAGGRVLGVTAKGKSLKLALDRCYEALERIDYQGKCYRDDIGKR